MNFAEEDLQNLEFNSMAVVIEPNQIKKVFPWALMFTLPTDLVLGIFEIGICSALGYEGELCISD